jgi:uncharacterized damage-inducible protein DinB
VRANTIAIAKEIPEDSYSFRPTPECRSVAETLIHIAVGARLQQQVHFIEHRNTLVGFDFFSFMTELVAEEQTPRDKAAILELLHTEGDKYAQFLEGLSEDFLAEQVQYPQGMAPPTKSRFEMLMGPKEHEMHHRGQLMVAERMIGITPHLTRQMMERVASMQATAKAAS